MKKTLFTLLLVVTLVFYAACSSPATPSGSETETAIDKKTLSIVTTVIPVYDFTKKIVGDHAEVSIITPVGQEPHHWEPTAKDMEKMTKADLFVYNGADLEPWISALLPKLEQSKVPIVNSSDGIVLQKYEEGAHNHSEEIEDSSHDHFHEKTDASGADTAVEQTDPHIWLNPSNVAVQMENITKELVRIDPDHRTDYEAKLAQQKERLASLDTDLKTNLGNLSQKTFITTHGAYGYLANAYGLQQIAIDGVMSHSEPSPAKLAEIIKKAQENHVNTIYYDQSISEKVANTVAQAIQGRVSVLYNYETVTKEQFEKGEDYFSIMRYNMEELVKNQ